MKDASVEVLVQPVWISIAAFTAALLLLDLFDISLPRGDSIGVSDALCAASLMVMGPLAASVVSMGSAVAANAIRKDAQSRQQLLARLVARGTALAVGTAVLLFLTSGETRGQHYLAASFVPAAFLLSDVVTGQAVLSATTARPIGRSIRGGLLMQAPLLVAEWSASVLLLIAFEGMGAWSLIPVVALLLLMRQSYSLLLDIRETYRTTVEVLVEAAEGEDPRLVGHAERTAEIARRIAMRLGMAVSQVELVSYAALLHDVDAIAGDGREPRSAGGHSSALFEGVEFFADVLPVLRVCDGPSATDPERSGPELIAGMIVALASDADAAVHEDVASAHAGSAVARVAPHVSSSIKSSVVAAALALGYQIPAVP